MIGYSDDGAVNYSEEPVYLDFNSIGDTESNKYSRGSTFEEDRRGTPDLSAGYVRVLQGGGGSWTEENYWIMDLEPDGFDNIGIDPAAGFPNGNIADSDIRGFAQMADDDLSVIKFIHTYQIPGLR